MPEGTELPKDIQGGAFYKGDLYLATNVDTAVWKVRLFARHSKLIFVFSSPLQLAN
jgi:hypothetical protein